MNTNVFSNNPNVLNLVYGVLNHKVAEDSCNHNEDEETRFLNSDEFDQMLDKFIESMNRTEKDLENEEEESEEEENGTDNEPSCSEEDEKDVDPFDIDIQQLEREEEEEFRNNVLPEYYRRTNDEQERWRIQSASDADRELQRMVGLASVKQEISDAKVLRRFFERRQERMLYSQGHFRSHMLFLGNPGTGKTSVAKLIGRMYAGLGWLNDGHTVCVTRDQLVGEYVGQTEQKTREKIEEAQGGVLFIDEAYTLVHSEDDAIDYGHEVINALLPVLSEPNPGLIVIMAGYEDKMKTMLNVNPGLRDRFPITLHFEDYVASELLEIAHRLIQDMNYRLTEEADKLLASTIEEAHRRRDKHFGNGRWVHNLIEQGVERAMARRVMAADIEGNRDDDFYTLIEESDVQEAANLFIPNRLRTLSMQRRIGFCA